MRKKLLAGLCLAAMGLSGCGGSKDTAKANDEAAFAADRALPSIDADALRAEYRRPAAGAQRHEGERLRIAGTVYRKRGEFNQEESGAFILSEDVLRDAQASKLVWARMRREDANQARARATAEMSQVELACTVKGDSVGSVALEDCVVLPPVGAAG